MPVRTALPQPAPSLQPGLLRLWLLRLLRALPRPLAFNKGLLVDPEAVCLTKFRLFLGAGAPRQGGWQALQRHAERCLGSEDPGGLLPLPPTPYLDCLRRLSELCGLTELEHQLLVWAYLMRFEEGLRFPSIGLGGYLRVELAELLGRVLGAAPGAVPALLQPDSPLVRSGLLELRLHCGAWWDWLDLPEGLVHALYLPPEQPLDLLKGALDPSPRGCLTVADFPHLGPAVETLLGYLGTARGRPGCNVLLHGPPGTGKTELVRALARAAGLRLFEVALADGGEPKEGPGRLRTYAAAQMLLARCPEALLLFDEMEGCLSPGPEGDFGQRGLKAWLNRSLESNPVPAFWVTNAVHRLDRAFLRRFDVCVEVGIPPRSVRRRILDAHLGGLAVAPELRERLAAKDDLAPALVARAARVTRQVQEERPQGDASQVFATVLQGSLRALGGRELPGRRRREGSLVYRLDAVQAEPDLAEVVAGLARHGQGRLCLYGPPGTGKSAFGRHLADALDRPLLTRRGSDLLSKWVGETERNLSRMFTEAAGEGAVLLLDEADAFLLDRRVARQSWEVAQVDELLNLLEGYDGIFAASTNLLECLDPAALRRFDLKIAFGYLKPGPAWRLFLEAARHLGLEAGEALRPALAALDCLTPRDFALVVQQAPLRPIGSARELLGRVREEVELKTQGRRRTVGF